LDSPFNKKENSIGRCTGEIITRFIGSQAEVISNTILETQKPMYLKEFESNCFLEGITYWDCNITPIFECGEMKYIYENSIAVTDRVLKNRSIEKQNKIIQQQKEQLEKKNIQLEIKNAQLTSVMENLCQAVVILDSKGKIIMINEEAKRLLYRSDISNALGDTFKKDNAFDMNGNRIPFENLPEIRALRGETVKNAKMFVSHLDKESFMEASAVPIYNTNGDLTMVVSCFHDITQIIEQSINIEEQKIQLEASIKVISEQNIQLNAVLDNMTEGVIVTNINGDIIKANQVALKMHGLGSFDEYTNFKRSVDDFEVLSLDGQPIPRMDRAISKALGGEVFSNYEVMVRRKDLDTEFIASYGGAPIYDENGEKVMTVITSRDITEHKMMEVEIKQQEEQLLKAEKEKSREIRKTLKSQGEFVANISHELRTPLNVIYATAQMFELYCNSGSLNENKSSIINYIHSIKQNSYRLSKLINNIVDSSKIEAGFFEINLSNNNIVEVVEEIVMSIINLTESKGLKIIFDTNSEEKIIACDPEKIERIVLNLISNAIKFSNVGDEIFVQIKDRNEFVEISVKDNGVGIKKRHLEMIFDRFKQVDKSLSRNGQGTGIGLNLVKSIVELHGGSISVESKFGKGSKFTVVIPTQKVVEENKLFDSNIENRRESIRVELSDIT